MSLPTIDRSKCRNDGLCSRVCPAGVLRLDPSGRLSPNAERRCLACGHCMSVCTAGAISIDGIQPDSLERLDGELRLSPAQAAQFLRSRRSIRAYRDEPLPRETIAQMLSWARYAPSGHNSQPLDWTVIYDRASVRHVAEVTIAWMRECVAAAAPIAGAMGMSNLLSDWDAGIDSICRDAPHLVVCHAPAALPVGTHAGAIAMTYLELAALGLGVGSCWAGFVFIGAGSSPEVLSSLGVGEARQCCGAAMLGRPAIQYRRLPARRQPEITWR